MTEGNAAAFEVIRGELDCDTVPLNNFDKEFTHLAGNMGKNGVSVLKLDTEERIGQDFRHLPVHLNNIFLDLWF